MEIRDLNEKKILLIVGGAGSLTAQGKTGTLQLFVTGPGNFKGDDLKCTNAVVDHQGPGKATVAVSNELQATIHGDGIIEYVGNPKVQQSIHGVGTVIQHKGK
jgi:hypothetical protein